MDYAKESLRLHEKWKGKIEMAGQREPVRDLLQRVPEQRGSSIAHFCKSISGIELQVFRSVRKLL